MLCTSIFAGVGAVGVQAQVPSPFMEYAEALGQTYGVEMASIRLAALAAFADPPPQLIERTARSLQRDLLRFRARLDIEDPSLAHDLWSAVGALESAETAADVQAILDRAREVQAASGGEQGPVFQAALATMLLLADDGVAEAYEDAADGDPWAYPNGWAALARVRELWVELRPHVADDVAFEIADMLDVLQVLYPSPEPPAEFRGDPEEAEAPAHRLVGFLETGLGISLHPDRDLGSVARLTETLTGQACEAYSREDAVTGAQYLIAAEFQYREYLRRLMGLFAPELDEDATDLFEGLLSDGVADRDAAATRCFALKARAAEARELLGG